jgi:predicted small integral membrane protein
MMTRAAKLFLVLGIALLETLLVFNNLNDFDSNYQFVRHVLMMDTTSPGNHGQWRAIASPTLHLAFYLGIIAWESVTAVLLWWGAARLGRALRQPASKFDDAKGVAVGLSGHWRGMVPHVAVARLEWTGIRVSHVRGCRTGAVDSAAARDGRRGALTQPRLNRVPEMVKYSYSSKE